MKALFEKFDAIQKLEADLRNAIEEILIKKEFRKKVHILQEGDIAKYIFFIEKGLVRSYRYKNGKEKTTWLMKEGDLFASVGSFFFQRPATETIETMEDCIFHGISFDQLHSLYKRFPQFNLHRSTLLEYYYMLSDSREHMRMQSASEKFLYLMEHQPELVGRVSDKYLASYLGIGVSTFALEKNRYAIKRK